MEGASMNHSFKGMRGIGLVRARMLSCDETVPWDIESHKFYGNFIAATAPETCFHSRKQGQALEPPSKPVI